MPNEEPKPLSTNGKLSKRDLIEYLQNADIPDDAECTLLFDDGKGVFDLHFYWSEGVGAFGQTAINFDVERPDLIRDFLGYIIKLKPEDINEIKGKGSRH